MKKKTNTIPYLFFVMALFYCAQSHAAVKLPALFSDGMILQQKAEVRLWGRSLPGQEITVVASWQTEPVHTRADDRGGWKTSLQTPKAGGPYKIKITGENTVEINDVLIGEVWLCSGQSNMTFPLKYSSNAKEEIAKADFPFIRYFGVQRQYGSQPLDDCAGSAWKKTSPGTAPDFSAVAFHFAKKLHAQLKIPIGIICSGWTGTPAEAWTPKTILQNDDSLQFFLKRWKEIPQKVGADSVYYHLALEEWKKNRDASANGLLRRPDEPRTYYYFSKPWCEPGVLFNGMINPLIPFTVKGILWYQGESNVSEADRYERLFTAMINGWRQQWSEDGQKQLPFYFVQIAPFGYGNLDAAARLRQAQYNVMKKVDNTAMAVTIDVGDMNNIHFTHKKEVGDRLALIALAKSYGCKNLEYEGPLCNKIYKVNNKLELHFDQPLFTGEKENPEGFEIGYKNPGSNLMQFVKAQSTIKGNKVVVWNNKVTDPLMVRYAWLEAGDASLINKAGLPAYPFQRKVD
jgi:sialate O-acetylesterase